MITDKDLTDDIDFVNKENNIALVWVIDGDCLYDIPTSKRYGNIFLDHDEAIDVSQEYNVENKIVVRFTKNNEVLMDLETSEYFGSILLSNPSVVDLSLYPYGRYVQSPYAKFDGSQFIILNQDQSSLMPWYTE